MKKTTDSDSEGVQGRDLGSVSGDIGKIVSELQKELEPGSTNPRTSEKGLGRV